MTSLSRYAGYTPGLYGLPHMGEVIADYRKKAGWSQEAFAIVCGVDRQTVTYWETSKYLADMERRAFLCKVLHIPIGLLGLTWRSVTNEETTSLTADLYESMSELLEENAYALYEDILTFAHTSTDKYSPEATYRFYQHQKELEKIVELASEIEKESWKDLLSRYLQHSTFIAQHHRQGELAFSYANKALDIASSLGDVELVGAALYRRARVHLIQGREEQAKIDIVSALEKVERVRGQLKGSTYLLAAELNSLYAGTDEKLRTQCRKWQDKAATLLYKGKVEDDGTFLTFSLYAVQHERAKTLLRFALFHTTEEELVEQLKGSVQANKALLKDAQSAITAARDHLETISSRKEMYLSLTEARLHLIAREHEESARAAKKALQVARKAYSEQGIGEVNKLYTMLSALVPQNPYVCNLGIELGIFPQQ